MSEIFESQGHWFPDENKIHLRKNKNRKFNSTHGCPQRVDTNKSILHFLLNHHIEPYTEPSY